METRAATIDGTRRAVSGTLRPTQRAAYRTGEKVLTFAEVESADKPIPTRWSRWEWCRGPRRVPYKHHKEDCC